MPARRSIAICLVLTVVYLLGLQNHAAQASRPRSHIKTVFLILMENHNWSDIKGSSSAPYINHVLLPRASYASRYYNPPGVHPSLPNYLWLEAGADFGISDDGGPDVHHQRTSRHLTALLELAHISWKAYEEGISGKTCPVDSSGAYAVKHNPMVYFDDVRNSPSCMAHERPFNQFSGDLRHGTVARYNFITPNLCHDMHDSCAPIFDAVKVGDTWLSHAVPMILRSSTYRQGGALFITWDEGEGGDGPIGMIVLSPYARGHGYVSGMHYTHSSTLRSMEEILGVGPLLGDASRAGDLRALFRVFP
jgi:phosphatidylinositol-3-phosphatase